MAKFGKENSEFDPFQAGNRAFGDLDKVLTDLDKGPAASSAPAPEAKPQRHHPKSKPKAAPPPREMQRTGRSEARQNLQQPGAPEVITKRVKTSAEEAKRLDHAAMRLGAALGVRIDFSKITRALWEVYLRHEEDILRNVPDDLSWGRPSNNDAVGLAELDEQIADLLNDGLMVASRRPRSSRSGD
jgi:hypothetical protein